MRNCGFIRREAERIALCNRMDADSVEGRYYFPGGRGLLDIDVDENGNAAFWFYAGAQMREYNDNPIYRKHEEHETPRLTYNGQELRCSLWDCKNAEYFEAVLPFFWKTLDSYAELNETAKKAVVEYFDFIPGGNRLQQGVPRSAGKSGRSKKLKNY